MLKYGFEIIVTSNKIALSDSTIFYCVLQYDESV